MRHLKRKVRLTKTQGQRSAILMNLAKSVFQHKRIDTTYAKAKAVQPFVEKIITYAKKEGLHAYRLVESQIHDQRLTKQVVETIAPHYKNRNGGYTRVVKMEARRGDCAPMAVFELIGDYSLKTKKVKKAEAEAKSTDGAEKKPKEKKVVKKVKVAAGKKESSEGSK